MTLPQHIPTQHPLPAPFPSPLALHAVQVRVPVSEIAALVRSLVDSTTTWAEVQAKYPAQAVAADGEDQA